MGLSSTTPQSCVHEPSPLDQRCDGYIHDQAALNPLLALTWGLGEPTGQLPDYSPAGYAAAADLTRSFLADVDVLVPSRPGAAPPVSANDAVTAAAVRNREQLELDLDAAGENLRQLNNIASPLQEVRDSFDMLPRKTYADWEVLTTQALNVSPALDDYRRSLSLAASRGQVAAQRQVRRAADQAQKLADISNEDSFFAQLRSECATSAPGLVEAVESATAQAAASYGQLSQWLRQDLLPLAPEADAIGVGDEGRERYQKLTELFIGTRVDLEETYQWGLEELERIDAHQRRIAAELFGAGTSVRQALQQLNEDPQLQVHGTDALKEWMQSTADRAIADLNGTEFNIPEPLRTIECLIAPSGEGGIYYTEPSMDFSRPGRMWWAVPPSENVFHLWQERTTVYHEGVPGHHLQIGTAISRGAELNLWRRVGAWNSGYGEGWALYAEQLMVELGYQRELPDLMGVWDAQRLRAARVALDIGVHLGLPRPDGVGVWDADFAAQFLRENVAMSEGFLDFELDRYLGWPGQAPSYKVGQRLWNDLRADFLRQVTPELSASEGRRIFHSRALGLGALPMDTLRTALLGDAAGPGVTL